MKRFANWLVCASMLLVATTTAAATYSYTNIIDSSVAAPTGNYLNIGDAAISGNKVAFKAGYNQGFLGIIDSIFISTGGPRTEVVHDLMAAPSDDTSWGRPPDGGTISAIGRPAIDGRQVYFETRVFYPDFRYGDGIFYGEGQQLQNDPLISTAVSPRALPQFQTYRTIADPIVSNGYVAYRKSSGETSALDTIRVLNRERTSTAMIVGAGSVGPQGRRFSLIDANYDLSGATVAFRGVIGDQEGIYTGSGGGLATIAKEGDPTPFGEALISVLDPTISGSTVAFLGTFAGGSGIFTGDGGALSTIVKTGDATPGGQVFTGFSVPALAFNMVAFRGDYLGGGGIYTKRGNELSKVVEVGDPLFGSTVASLSFGDLGLDVAGSGNLAFTYGLADGRSGVAMAVLGAGQPTIFQDSAGTIPVPDSVGIDWVPVPNFSDRNLTRAWLVGADLRNANARNVNLTNAKLRGSDLSDADLSGANLRGAGLAAARLTGANLSGADIRGASLRREFVVVPDACFVDFCSYRADGYGGITPAQLAATMTYQSHDLSGIDLEGNDLSDANLAGQNLTGANFAFARLTNANLAGAEIRGASFGRYGLDIPTEIEFCEHNTHAGCPPTGLIGTGISVEQLQSTASYLAGDLSGVNLAGNELAGVNLAGQNLANADFYGSRFYYSAAANLANANLRQSVLHNVNLRYATLTNANLSGADARGASLADAVLTDAVLANFIHSDGHVNGIDLGAGQMLLVRDYDGGAPCPATQCVQSPPIPITVDQSFAMDSTGRLRMEFEADAWDSTISFAAGIPVTLGGTLELTFDDDVSLATQIGRTFDLFDWTGVSPIGAFTVASSYIWDLSQLYTTGDITFLAEAGLSGDFNGDGSVDAADYVVWRKTGGTQQGYDTWRANYGRVAGGGGSDGNRSALPAVPEPTGLALVAGAVLGPALGYRRRFRAGRVLRRRESRLRQLMDNAKSRLDTRQSKKTDAARPVSRRMSPVLLRPSYPGGDTTYEAAHGLSALGVRAAGANQCGRGRDLSLYEHSR
jgi:uncharacterized protein YjbI with pentapeptide repeats